MTRWRAKGFAAVVVLLTAAIGVAFVRSLIRPMGFWCGTIDDRLWMVALARGNCAAAVSEPTDWSHPSGIPRPNWRWSIAIPLWMPLLAASGASILRVRAALAKRPRPGECVACGYDLGSLRLRICPECGAMGSNPALPSAPSA